MPPGRPRIFVRIRSASASPTGVCNTHRKPMNSTIMATIGIAWSSRNVQSSPGGGGVGGPCRPCSIVTLYASRSLRVSAASAGRPEPLALATLREQPLGEVHSLAQLAHFGAELVYLARELGAEFMQLPAHVLRQRAAARAADALGNRPAHGRNREQKQRSTPEEQDDAESTRDVHDRKLLS